MTPLTWTPEQDAIIRKGYLNGRAVNAIARDVGRRRESVVDRAIKLGLRKPAMARPEYTEPVVHTPSIVDIPALRRPLP